MLTFIFLMMPFRNILNQIMVTFNIVTENILDTIIIYFSNSSERKLVTMSRTFSVILMKLIQNVHVEIK